MLSVLAIPLGIRIAFKGVPWSHTVRNCVAAGDLVFRANCPNLGLAIDAFDVLAARVPLDDLDAIDPEQIFLVQLSDYMWQEILTLEEQAATATHFRVFPGEGAHSDDLAAFVNKLDAIGYRRQFQLRRLQRRLPANAARHGRQPGATRRGMARRNGAAACTARAQHGTFAAHCSAVKPGRKNIQSLSGPRPFPDCASPTNCDTTTAV